MKAFITVIGHDTVGVVAKVAGLCTELNINIEDVTPSILQKRADALAAEMGMQINVTRQEVFDAMHTI